MADAGIGETMLISAAIGGGSSALRGQDPLKGALMGGALGGIGYGLSGALGSAFGTQGALNEAAALSSGAEGALQEEIARQQFQNLGVNDIQTLINPADVAAQQISSLPTNQFLTDQAKQGLISSMQSGADPAGALQSAKFLSQYTPPPTSGIAGLGTKAADWLAANPTKAALGFAGLPTLGAMSKPATAANFALGQTYSGPLSFFKYDPRQYTPDIPMPPSPAYRAQYAEGGIAALAQGGLNAPTGPVERMSQNIVGQGGMYPQSQMDKTYFATPTQMPASAEVIGADYDVRTNPYTGAMMASGGAVALAMGGKPVKPITSTDIDDQIEAAIEKRQSSSQNKKDFLAQHNAALRSRGIGAVDLAHGGVAALKEGSFVVPADVVSHMGNGSTDAGIAALHKHTGAKPIRGQGDGMSDSIPTSIDGRQKARVADGEAVIEPEQVKRLGKGSSKAGAKKLYAMMDKVRKARTGTEKQGRQINPAKYMPA